ncbi:MAG TPA: class F sortase [Clostridia bacterium]|nr:class F sortase [Clostridia bacterium]
MVNWRRIVLFLFILAGLVEGSLVGYLFYPGQKSSSSTGIEKENSAQPTQSWPQKLVIPKINVEAEVVPVGINSQGEMEMPQNPWLVAWYQNEIQLGKKGSLVLAGHLDSKTGPAVFYQLVNLEIGDEIEVFDQSQKKFVYLVIEKETFAENKFPLEKVFAANDKKRLNLITCRGVFDKTSQRYNQRVVVFTEFKESKNGKLEDEKKP